MIAHRHRLLKRCLALLSGAMLGSLAGPPPALPMSLVEQVPVVTEIIDGSALAFALRFDQPINHYRSTLTLVTPDGTSPLGVRLSAQPNTLYSAIGRLMPGSYELRWHAHTANGEILAGMIPFSVTR
jgi:methionine-rich copper-binding protein CopC